MADHRHGFERGTRRGVVEGFAHLPRAAHFFGFALHVAARHIEADAVAEHVIERFFNRYVFAALADSDRHLNFVMQVFGHRRIGDSGAVHHNGIRRLHEEKRRFAIRVMAHFPGVFGVVAPHAVNTAYGENLRAFGYRQSGDSRKIYNVSHGFTFYC